MAKLVCVCVCGLARADFHEMNKYKCDNNLKSAMGHLGLCDVNTFHMFIKWATYQYRTRDREEKKERFKKKTHPIQVNTKLFSHTKQITV